MADVSVRPARPEDAAEIARIQVDTWRIAYTSALPAAALEAVTPEAATEQWTAAIRQPPTDRHHVLVAWEQDWRVGFVAFGPSDPDDLVDPAEADLAEHSATIRTILVEPRWGRRGHGSRLLAAAVDHLRVDDLTHLLTWVLDDDEASKRFYGSAGWEPDGWARTLDLDGDSVREVRLAAEVAPDTQDG